MSKGPENRLIAAISRLLPDTIHKEKMHNPYRGGTADVWYSAKKADLWVEYKWIPSLPRTSTAVILPALSALQVNWLGKRFEEGRNVKVFVGCPDGVVWFNTPAEWERGITAKEFQSRLVDKRTAASWIAYWTEGTNESAKNASKSSKQHVIDLQNRVHGNAASRTSKIQNER